MSRINFRKLRADRKKEQGEQIHNLCCAIATLTPVIEVLRTMSGVMEVLRGITDTP